MPLLPEALFCATYRMKNTKIIALLLCSHFLLNCSKSDDPEDAQYLPILTAEPGEERSGGNATVFNKSEEAFGFACTNLSDEEQTAFGVGNSFFRQTWVSAPSSTTARDGLGPFYNATACASCHFKDGRGRPPLHDGEFGRGLLLRLTLAGHDTNGNPFTDPVYGGQLQDNAILGQIIKGNYNISYAPVVETLAGGTSVELQKPTYQFINLGYGPMAAGLLVSPRVASQMVGLGLLEALPEADILSRADEADLNGDGISGKANYVYDIESSTQKLGRFGWKANEPSIKQQVAGAFSGDMGITSSLFPNENCPPGVDCNTIPNGGSPEIPDLALSRVVLYSSTLAVPARRNYADQNVLEGKKVFQNLKCIACHTPKMQTGNTHPVSALRNQTIRPYTDLLLHDMGPELADNAPSFLASGSEWRTPPLWGIGLINVVNGHTRLLHDGRARNIEEAILWHGGEAQGAKDGYKQLTARQRTNLLAFINSL